MQKAVYSIVGVIALAAVAIAIYLGVTSSNPFADTADSDEQLIAVTDGDELRDIIVTPTPLAPSAELEDAMAEPAMIEPGFGGPDFANLEITLDTAYLAQQNSAPTYGFDYAQTLSVAEMEEIARLFGFSDGLLKERIDFGMGEAAVSETLEADSSDVADAESDAAIAEDAIDSEMVDTMPFDVPESYVAIDGTRRLFFYGNSANYQDTARIEKLWNSPSPTQGRMPYEEALQVAETFMLERDLLPDSYAAQRGWDGSVQFVEVLDGIEFSRPVATVHILEDGAIASIEYMPTIVLEELAQNELISAETAFNNLLAGPGKYQFDFQPSDDFMPDESMMPRNWQREFAPDAEIIKMTWLQVFEPVDGGPAVIWAENVRVEGSDELMAQLSAEATQRGVVLTGTMRQVDGVDVMTVTSYEVSNTSQDVYMNGTIERDGDTATLVVPGGLALRLPDAPAELEAGLIVGVQGYSISNGEDGQPVFDWMRIDEQIDYSMMEEHYANGGDPYSASSLNIDSVTLVYQSYYDESLAYRSSAPMEPTMEKFIPMYAFFGTTDQGSTLEFWVPAIDLEAAGK